ncbi:hypothetical protein METBIDRAFT_85317 [Metschnikowia bicuspidata var. bicuspidata NRRL YB-4993]|uniref:DNA damage checkpoint protein LCD1 n=1 Tax=Metschnikowia bicuspidata var. bicuspidata NRRL YB-4993 TaxID=869754 RepID=A0A1A0HFM4_9ASCO|nr:hypothetical protein METBIDRAFT_85317 [Metschnikowia bicuspidata var. bicuspidata NRRL YB-4993]OBA22954.1 hypothetical protein METBIDRAFT_85317 [Metschnikowia bicuspidata var. bicuspidata NRRL YB-4993]
MALFDDDDDALLLQLVGATPRPPPAAAPAAPHHQAAPLPLFRAQGEISILRAQLEALQNLRSREVAQLSAEAQALRLSAQEHVALLKLTVDKLEDEKKFLGNELRSLSSVKRRRVSDHSNGAPEALQWGGGPETRAGLPAPDAPGPAPRAHGAAQGPRIQLQDDWSQLCHHLWRHTINGAGRTSMAFLSKICSQRTLGVHGAIAVAANTPLLSCVWDALLQLRHLRLDKLVQQACELLLLVIQELLRLHEQREPGVLVAVPFLISVVHAAANFKTSAVTESLATTLVEASCRILRRFVHVLRLHDEEDEASSGIKAVPYQQRLFENLILVLAFDVLESAAVISSQFGPLFSRHMWDLGVMDVGLMHQVLPENTERFVSSVQINLVSSLVEVLSASINENHFCSSDDPSNLRFVKSLLKVFIIDIRIKDDFMFYGLNRVLGNNLDLDKISQAVPPEPERLFNKTLVSIPYPVRPQELDTQHSFTRALQHDCHLLALRVRIVMLLESIAISSRIHLLNLKENIKSIVRIIGYEQNLIIHQPRSQLIHMRLTIITVFVRILFYVIEEERNINTLIYPETLYEIFVVLLRIAFASDSLSFDAHELLSQIRAKGFTETGVFNRSCESRSREMAHFDLFNPNPQQHTHLAGIEGDFANGLEFPYDLDTIEIAREILNVCVNHDEADNLYYNMNKEAQ